MKLHQKEERQTPPCPVCRGSLVSEPIGTPLHCTRCRWHLITLEIWKQLPPLQQGYAMYMQSAWPTSPLAEVTNPYAEGTPAWRAFQQGEQRGEQEAQDSEE
jgi:hypothetical protein